MGYIFKYEAHYKLGDAFGKENMQQAFYICLFFRDNFQDSGVSPWAELTTCASLNMYGY